MKNNRRRNKMETSKKILLVSYISAIILTIIVIIGTFTRFDTSNITTIASLAWAEVGATNIWYYKKAAKENVPKIISSLPKEFQDHVDVNQLSRND